MNLNFDFVSCTVFLFLTHIHSCKQSAAFVPVLLCRIVKDVVEGPSQNLLESVAHRIASATLLKFSQISAVRVEVKQPHVAVQGIIDYLGVEIVRHKKYMAGSSTGAD